MNKKLHYKTIHLKIIVFMVMCYIFCLSNPSFGAQNDTNLAQLIQQKKVTLNLKNVSIESILYEIKKQSGLGFILRKDVDVKLLGNMSLKVDNLSVAETLNKLFENSDYTYSIAEKVITIIKKPAKNSVSEKSIQSTISGTVLDSKKNFVVGATVLVKGSPNGAITDSKGAFLFTAEKTSIIEISFIGKKNVTLNWVDHIGPIVVEMVDDVLSMDDVVVTGYQNLSRRDAVMSQTTVKADDINIAGATSITDMLQGQVAGMIVTNSSSRAGSTPKIKIRGTSTLGNTDPLFVVDGIIQPDPIKINSVLGMVDDLKNIIGDQVSWLNPQDINTVTILKDASATAVYGSRASNGVIVITTKRPKFGDKLSISYRGTMTVAPGPNYDQFNYMNSQERIIFSEEAFAGGARYEKTPIMENNTYEGIYAKYLNGMMSQDDYFKRKNELELMNTDWFDILTRTAISQNHNISVSGASEKATYRISAGYNRTNGVEKGNNQDRFTANTSVSFQFNPKLSLTLGINASITDTKGYGPRVNPLKYATETSRSIPAYEKNGEYAYYKKFTTYLYNDQSPYLNYNFLNELENGNSSVDDNRFGANLTFNWKITKWLTYEFTGGANFAKTGRESYASEKTHYIATCYRGYDYGTVDPTDPWYTAALLPNGGEKYTSNASNRSYNIQNKLMVNHEFNPDNRLNVMLAMEVSSSANKDMWNTMYGFSADRGNFMSRPTLPSVFKSLSIRNPKEFGVLDNLYPSSPTISDFTNNFTSFFMTAAYSFRNRYVLNANLRNDMSNRFGQNTNNRFDPTYSFGLGWQMSEEPFMEEVSRVFSYVKFGITYGVQGNANLSTSPELILRQAGIVAPFEDYTAQIISIPNPNLGWERTKNWNYSVNIGLFNKVNLVVDYYHRSSNAIAKQDIPFSNGIKQMDMNAGKLYNNGFEATLSFNPVATKNFGINVSINSSKNWNKGGETSNILYYDDYLNGVSESVIREGYPVSAFWSYDFAGVNDKDGKPMFNNLDVPENVALADPTTVLVYSGQKEPDFTGGLNLSLRYRNLTLSSTFSLLLGGNKRLTSPYSNFPGGSFIPDATTNISKDLNNRWKKPGDVTDIPGVITGYNQIKTPFGYLPYSSGTGGLYDSSSALVVSSSFFRCRNLSLNYRFGDSVIQKIGFSSLTVGASVSNLFVIASDRYKGFDPELNNSVQPKGYSLSISIGF